MSTGTCGGGQIGDAICANPGECCSAHGYCGTTPEHCAANSAVVDGMIRVHVNSVRATASDEPGPEMRGDAHPTD